MEQRRWPCFFLCLGAFWSCQFATRQAACEMWEGDTTQRTALEPVFHTFRKQAVSILPERPHP